VGLEFLGKGRDREIRFVTTVQTSLSKERPFSPTYPTPSPTATEHRVSLGEGHAQGTPATSWEQGTTEYRPSRFLRILLSLPPGMLRWMCIVEAHDAVSHLPFWLTCLEGPVTPLASRASLPYPLPALMTTRLCWVHHNNFGRDEVVLQACIHDTKHNQYLKRERV
jgi:hypothetical protein